MKRTLYIFIALLIIIAATNTSALAQEKKNGWSNINPDFEENWDGKPNSTVKFSETFSSWSVDAYAVGNEETYREGDTGGSISRELDGAPVGDALPLMLIFLGIYAVKKRKENSFQCGNEQ